MIFFLLLITWFGLHGINMDDLWYDEYRTFWYAGVSHYGPISLAQTWERVSDNAVQTPGYYLLLNRWERIAGDSEFANRYPSLLFGLLALAVMLRAGREMFDDNAAVGACIALGGSAFFQLFLHEMRTYTLVMLCSGASVWLYWRLISGKTDITTHLFFALALLGLPYTHYYAMMVGGAIAVYHLLFAPKNRDWLRVTGIGILVLLLFLPWVNVLMRGATGIRSDEARVIYALTPTQVISSLSDLFSNGNSAFFVFLLVFAAWLPNRNARLVWFIALMTVLLSIVGNAWSGSLSQTRYLLMTFPLLALLVGIGISRLARVGVAPVIPLAVWLIWGLWNSFLPGYMARVHNADWYFPWSRMVNAAESVQQPGDHLLVQLPHLTGAFAHEPLVEHYLHDLPLTGGVIEYPFSLTEADYTQVLREAVQGYDRLWIARQAALVNPADADRFATVLAQEGYAHCLTAADVPDLHVDLYAHMPAIAPIQYEAGIQAALVPTNLPDNVTDSVTLTLMWQIDESVPSGVYSYGVHVTDESGQLVTQVDNGLPEAGIACTPVVLGLQSLPTGTLDVNLLVYEWQTGDRLTGSYNNQAVDQFVIGQIER